LQAKFANNWVSVRKAFLDLDFDYDGTITVADIVRFFGSESIDINIQDLQKLIIEKDSSKRGQINYKDFSSWMGGVIHSTSGFYFRHDSMRNPQYERNLENITAKRGKNDNTNEQLLGNLEKQIFDKFFGQWKTLKKAF